MPWQSSGAQVKRIWPIAAAPTVLELRWKGLLTAKDRVAAFKETRDRKITTKVSELNSPNLLSAIEELATDEPMPRIAGYGYRSFDRQFLLADNRLGDYLRPSLWASQSDRQVYFASLLTSPLGYGPALTASALVPDLHYFSGRGARDVLPLYRDSDARTPNVHHDLLPLLSERLDKKISAADFAAYLYGVLAHPHFTEKFALELGTKQLRVPITVDAKLFRRAVEIGSELLFLHTYGERSAEGPQWPDHKIKCIRAVPSDRLPEKPDYDSERKVIKIETGEFGPVSQAVWDFEVSGLKVVQSWLGYRKRNRTGKKSSPLDAIRPAGWPAEYTSELVKLLNIVARTLEMYPKQAELLETILRGPTLGASDIGPVPEASRKSPKRNGQQEDLDLT